MKQLNTYINEALIKKDTQIKNHETYDNYIIIPYHQQVYSLLKAIDSDMFYTNSTDWWLLTKDEILSIINILKKLSINTQDNPPNPPYLLYGIKENINDKTIEIIKENLYNFKFLPAKEDFFKKLFPKIEDISKIE